MYFHSNYGKIRGVIVKKERFAVCAGVCYAAGTLLCGCGNEIPQMTLQQQNMVTEYATGIVLKHSSNFHDKLSFSEIGEEMLPQTEMETTVKDAETAQEVDVTKTDDAPDGGNVQEEVLPARSGQTQSDDGAESVASLSLEEVLLQAPAFQITYDGYEICDAYSGEDEGAFAFEMTASPNKKLLVLKFNIVNVSGQEQHLDVLPKNAKAKITVAGSTQNALVTMLDNDLLTADTILNPDEEKIFVMIAQIDEDSIAGDIQLSVSCQGNRAQYMY